MAESCNKKHPVLAVVGPTATGKTALGVALAEAFEGEVISADSMQIYKGLDVGTAKVANLVPRAGSKRSTALTSPRCPTLTMSS